ncbi:resistin-like beta [Microcebus murinus]|uniref:resistin-like beta n=1 Tax=Microcebus murinus TaxID=30608 RepID=UPI0001773410
MKPGTCPLFILIPLLQLVIPGSPECSLDTIVENKIKDILNGLEYNPSATTKQLVCTSITNSGKLSSCPAGMSVTGCACGYACGSWDVRQEKTCHCQCSVVDWTTARCCRLA